MKTVIIAFLIGWIFRGFVEVLYPVVVQKLKEKKNKENTVTLTKAEYGALMRLMEKEKARAKTCGFSRALMEDKANDEDGEA